MKNQDEIEKSADRSRRRRSFLAVKQEGNASATIALSSAGEDDDDIPVLTEVVSDSRLNEYPFQISVPPLDKASTPPALQTSSTISPIPAISAMKSKIAPAPIAPFDISFTADAILPVAAESAKIQAEELADQMMQAISKQMAYELPSLIEATLMSVSVELRTGIMATMDAALRDFVASQKK